jgi:hypothetical protein
MEAPSGPLRSPDGLWWWDGKAWQPIASLAVPPTVPLNPTVATVTPPPAEATKPSPGAWQPPPASAEPVSGAWQPPPAAAEPAPVAWQPPAPPEHAETWPPAGGVAPDPVAAAPTQPAVVPPTVVPPPPPPAPAEPPKEEVQWPTWLPQTPAAEKVIQGVPTRHQAAVKPPPAGPAAPPPAIVIPSEARSSSWVSQLYPAAAGLTSNRRLLIGVGLAVLGLVALIIAFQVISQSLGSIGAGTSPDQGPTGTQYQQADGFLAGSLNPALTGAATAVAPIAADCAGAHSVTCRGAIEDADTAAVKAIAIIDKGAFPACLATSVVPNRQHLVTLDQALKTGLIGFHSNSEDLISKGIKDSAAASPALKTDQDALKATQVAACPKTP